jgi:hypothetical protein
MEMFFISNYCKERRMTMNIRTLANSAVLSSLVSLSCYAGGMTSENEKLFRDLDTDKNNVLSVEEAQHNTLVMEQFDKIDKNNDKQLEASEFSAFETTEHFEPPEMDEPGVGAAPMD